MLSSRSVASLQLCRRRVLVAAASHSPPPFHHHGGLQVLPPSSSLSSLSTTMIRPSYFNSRYVSSHSSFDEPSPSLAVAAGGTNHSEPPDGSSGGSGGGGATGGSSSSSSSVVSSADRDFALRQDIRVMGSLLGQTIKEHTHESIFEHVEAMRKLAKQWREAGTGRVEATREEADQILKKLADYASQLSEKELFLVSRAFTHFLALANAAESNHRTRMVRLDDSKNNNRAALHSKPDSCGGVLPSLLAKGHSKEDIWKALTTQTTELVLTAHPTEVNRRTILDKKRRIHDILEQADQCRSNGHTLPFEIQQLDEALSREISSIWLSDEVARVKPTPQTEAQKGTLVVETVLWETVPTFLRKLDRTMQEFLGEGLPLHASPIKFASWMGGDRDGNPNVMPNTTREVCLQNRAKAAMLLARDLAQLERELSITTCSNELLEALKEENNSADGAVFNPREPYRAFLKPRIAKMQRTQAWAEEQLFQLEQQEQSSSVSSIVMPGDEKSIYLSKQELLSELMMLHRSLCATKNELIADGHLTDIIRNVSAFGLTLVPLDIRQESGRHEEAIDCITRFLGLGSYSQWDEQTKINWLTQQITSKRPLLRAGIWHEYPEFFPPTAIDTLEIHRMIAEQPPESLGAYVISQATTASDVLAVLLLQLDAGVKDPLRVVPLFETLDDLNGAPDTMKTLFSLPSYMGIIKGKQEVMIGYSDSAKDAGRIAAVWAQFETQETLAQLARQKGVDLNFFHGKGGTVGRGGNPQTFTAITAHPPKTINGKFRVTEQGEMIDQNFGYPNRAERTLDIYTAAVLAEKLLDRPSPPPEYRSMMKKLSQISCDGYRRVVRGDPRFVPYFRAATPEQEFGRLNIGSRPAKRKATGGVESLRAIPWIFAWTQTRSNLPTWLGAGEALRHVLQSEEAPLLRDMYSNWDSFRTTVDLLEMVLSKSEPAVVKHYESKLVTQPEAVELGKEVRELLVETEAAILELTGHTRLGDNNMILTRALSVRNPYVDCLNILQAEALQRIRQYEDGSEGEDLKDALLTTITGIANGMGNTG